MDLCEFKMVFPNRPFVSPKAMPAQMRLLALRLADGLAEAAQQTQILLPEAGILRDDKTDKTESKPGMIRGMVSERYLLCHGDYLMTEWFTSTCDSV